MVRHFLTIVFFLSFLLLKGQPACWVGGVTRTSAVISCTGAGNDVALYLTGAGEIAIAPQQISTSPGGEFRKYFFTELVPSHTYSYFMVTGGDTLSAGNLKTAGDFSYSFLAGSCTREPDHPVFDAMRNEEADFLLITGDIHYEDIAGNDRERRMQAYQEKVLSDRFARLLAETPVTYVWDDHDYCGNNAGSGCQGRPSALEAYRMAVPHHSLPFPAENIAQSFQAGRILFIVPDLRSERTSSRIYSSSQESWIREQLLMARQYELAVCIVSAVPWNGNGSDSWGAYDLDRRILADMLRDFGTNSVFMICGDAHMLAADNGLHTDYSSTTGGIGFPLFQCAALNQTGTVKGGNFTEGSFPNPSGTGQYGRFQVEDNGEEICVTFNGYRVNWSDQKEPVLSYTFCMTPGPGLSWRLLPNPASGSFTLRIENIEEASSTSIEVMDAGGRTVIREETQLQEGRSTITINPGPRMKTGIYLVRFTYKGVWYTQQLSYIS